MRLYTLFDRKMKEYGNLVMAQNDETVFRALREGIPAGSTPGKYPEDFDLFYVGNYDVETGVLGSEFPSLVGNLRGILTVAVDPQLELS